MFCRWHEATDARGAVVVVHGFGEHSGRYQHVFERLHAADYSCLGLDYRGWGKAGGRRGYVRRFSDYLDDVALGIDECRRRDGRAPFLLCHSQGALVGALLVIERSPDLRGVVLTSPAFEFSVPVPAWKRAVARVASIVWPILRMPSGIDNDLLTHDASVLEALETDELVEQSATARWYTESLAAQRRVLDGAAKLRLPMLVLAAGDDHIVGIETTRAFFAACASDDKTMHEYPGAYHEVLNEVDAIRERVFEHLLEWLAAHSPQPARARSDA